MRSSPAGYATAAYAASLASWGEPRSLLRSGGSVLVRTIPGSPLQDAVGTYPIFACPDWPALADDVDALERDGLVSLSLVADPLGGWSRDDLERAFPDLLRPYKEHFVVDLERAWHASAAKHHRRNVDRARGIVECEVVADPPTLLDDWIVLYDELIERHDIRGPARFSREAFAKQLAVPGIVALRARHDGATVGATLWYVCDDVAYYHLGAYARTGYELGASFALFATAFERLAQDGVRTASLGAGAGIEADPTDGLSRFKRGWASGMRTAWLCGRILRRDRYAQLAATAPEPRAAYFPAYRAGEQP